MGSKAFESPLISHARMRALYRALIEVKQLMERRKNRGFTGVEACWVGSAIDLQDGDLTTDKGDADEALVVDHIQAVGKRDAASPVRAAEVKRILRLMDETEPEVFPGTAADRLLCAVGQAMALRASGSGRIAMAYAARNELTAGEWKRVFAAMGQHGLPMVLMVIPEGKGVSELDATARKAGGVGPPVIPVDAGDAVGIYRVTQETTLRARTAGGAAVIEAIGCGTDAVKLLGSQLVKKRICTDAWVARVETQMRGLVAR